MGMRGAVISIFIMSLTRNNLYHIASDPIYQSVYIINPAAPKATHISS